MSYLYVQDLTIKPDGAISMRAANSNEQPRIYDSVHFQMMDNETVAERMQLIYERIASGEWEFHTSQTGPVYQLFLEAVEEMEEEKSVFIRFGGELRYEPAGCIAINIKNVDSDVFRRFQLKLIQNL